MNTNNCEDKYRSKINNFVEWCDRKYLIFNVQTIKEMIFYFWTKTNIIEPLEINNTPVEVVHEFKYLGTLVDDKLNWDASASASASAGYCTIAKILAVQYR